jgi:hypothetical protein
VCWYLSEFECCPVGYARILETSKLTGSRPSSSEQSTLVLMLLPLGRTLENGEPIVTVRSEFSKAVVTIELGIPTESLSIWRKIMDSNVIRDDGYVYKQTQQRHSSVITCVFTSVYGNRKCSYLTKK